LNQRTHELSERVKELNCFYELEKISRTEKITIEKLLKSAVRLLPPSWEYPDITGVCIVFDGKKYKTKNFKRTKWMQSADIVVDNKKAGCIEVCYLEEKPDMDEGPFLRDERYLIDAVTSRIVQSIERKQKEEALEDSEERLRILFDYAPDAYYINDLKGNFIDGNKAAEKLTGYKRKELVGKNFLKLKLFPPEQMPKATAFLAKNLMGKATGPDEFVLTRKDGTRVYAEISTNPVKVKGKAVVLGIARDISKIKQAENKLKLERAYIDQLFESAQEAIVMLGKNGHIMRVNDEFIRLFGFSSYDEIVGKSVDDLVVPDDAREIAKSITNKVRMGNSVSLETVRQKKDGSLIDVSVLASPIEVDGKLLGIFGIYRDISERKQAEDAIRESEELFRDLSENSPNMIFINKKGKVIFANKKCEEIMGYKKEEFYSTDFNFLDLIAPEYIDIIKKKFNQHMRGENLAPYEFTLITKEGRRIEVIIATKLMNLKGERSILGIVTDITERKRAEEALAREQYLMQALMDNIPDYIYFKDRESQFVRISKAHSQSFGLSDPVQALGKTDFDFFTEEHARKAYEDEQKIIQTGQPVMNIEEKETRHGRPDAWVLTTKMPLRDREERIVGTFGISRDITERKQAEEQIFKQSAVLEAINKVFLETLTCEIDEEVARVCLAVAMELTGSQFGFIGEVNQVNRFDTIAQSDIGWEACRIPKSDAVVMIKDMEIRGIWGKVLKDEQSLIVNDPSSHPDRVGTPKGHPPLNAFLGVPLKHAGRTIGMIALANKEPGYDLADQQAIEDLSISFMEALNRKRAEQKLKVERAYIDTLYESVQEAIVMADKDDRVLRVNNNFLELFGFTKDEVVGQPVDDLIAPNNAYEIAKSITKRVTMGNNVSLETVRQRKNGTSIDVSVLASPILIDDKLIGTYAIYRDITERKKAEQKLKASLKEKEVLLREIHHRVKNNLQIISSLLLLQSNQISGKKNLELFQESQNRVKSMALIHEKLYQSQDLASINFKEYLNTLIIGLFRSYQSHSSHVELKLNIDDISLGIDSAIPCGLIINELVSNSLKYAFPNGREGVISVVLRSLNKKDVELVVSDNGIGMPEDLDFRNTKSLGLHLVTILAEDQLGGEIKLSRDKGTEFRIKLRGVK